ncbi:MAG TPA: tRNA (adenosine(37)-N6)-threonylcarbamoyltransferase complex transferase subunit TsaD [Candidatus Kapabacteria bacterium]|nr:tRNA (adenosine(37)-N6)-threonylcarbamoyltransferase complex transferase subunit TsaD [Candidatus Kapabacteria bacterium]
MKILAIETSCDDTAASIIDGSTILSNVISSQYFHSKYGGIIPELASRAHLDIISEIVEQALTISALDIKQIDAIAVTVEPGLYGSLVVGANFAKGLALSHNLPIVPINHIEGHLYSAMIDNSDLKFPFISLVVSGGHTALFKVDSFNQYETIGLTKDDAAGEAFDKIAKLLGLEYPGGPMIDKLAKDGNSKAYNFPRPMINDNNFNFSFSGLKTSVRYFLQNNFPNNSYIDEINNISASLQEAIVDVLVNKSIKAAKHYSIVNLCVSGGVSANSRLRNKMNNLGNKNAINVYFPNMHFCLDNAAMIGFLASNKLKLNDSKYNNLIFTVNSRPLRAKKGTSL